MIEDTLKDRIILVVSILCLIFFIWAVGVSNELGKQKNGLQGEIRKRLVFEEENINLLKEKAGFKDNARELTSQLEEATAKLAATEQVLADEQAANKIIADELNKMDMLKQALEEDLKEALVNSVSGARK